MSVSKATLLIFAFALVACQRSMDSTLVGEWTQRMPDIPNSVIYRPDHTYVGEVHDPHRGIFRGAGTWRIEYHQMICRDNEHGESRAEILKIAGNELQIKGPDGIVSTYARVK